MKNPCSENHRNPLSHCYSTGFQSQSFNPLARILFFKRFINVYIACNKECTMATRVTNPISLYYT